MSDMKIDSFTVSYAFDIYRGGEKTSHFLSMGVKLDPPVSMDEFPAVQLQAAYRVSVSAIHDALMRGAITVDDANGRISDLKNNYEKMAAKFSKV